MLVKQKRSAAHVAAVHVLLFGVVVVAVAVSVWLSGQIQKLPEPITRTSPAVYAKAAESRIEDQFNSTQLMEGELQSVVRDFAAEQSGEYGIYVEHLSTGVVAQHRASASMKSASLYKLFIAVEALKMVDDNRLVLDAIIDGERGYSLEKCLDIMITVSDNECGVILQRITGAANAPLPNMKVQGFDNTDLRGVFPTTSAKDVARAFKNLEEQTYLSPQTNAFLLDLLGNQAIRNRLPQGFPASTEIHHKTGDLNGFVHDAGLVRSAGGDYVIVVMSEADAQTSPVQRNSHIADLSKTVYETIAKRAP